MLERGADPEGALRSMMVVVDAMATVGVDREVSRAAIQAGSWGALYDREVAPLSGLCAALMMPFGAYELIDFLGASAPTVGEGFGRLIKYLPVVTSYNTFVTEMQGDEVRVRAAHIGGEPSWFTDEWLLGATIRGFRSIVGTDTFQVRRIELRRSNPGSNLSAFVEQARVPRIVYGQASSALVLSRELWEMPSPRANSRLHAVLLMHADEVLRETNKKPPSLAHRVRQELIPELRGGDPTVQVVAKKLATTPRTLQRRLSEEGTSFVEILDKIRAELSTRYLADAALSVTEVAFLLGFSEPSAFARAHRRWFGRAPRERSALTHSSQ
jgi:AraC-like DNA-binding protein